MAIKIEAGARRMQQMLAELVDALTFERAARLPLDIAAFDLLELLETTTQQFNVGGDQKVELHASSIPGYWCRGALYRAIENLVTNAIKYGDGGQVRIKADAIRGRLILSVHNTGNPIAADQRDRIFEYLQRDSASSAAQGWGIGLPYVRHVAESHGGSVAVDSSAASGTTFIVDIPVDCRLTAS
jgi:signal transduction histidine kinase